jgi:hypothetical protein
MNIWKRLASSYSPKLVEHPYAEMLLKAMAKAEPETLRQLKKKRCLDYYIITHVGDALKEEKDLKEGGADAGTAKQVALDNMLPEDNEEFEIVGSQEGAEEDAIVALNDYLRANYNE